MPNLALFVKKLGNLLAAGAQKLKKLLDIRDLLVFGGLGMLGYGLYLLRPWLAFTICGGLLMIIGYSMRGK